MILASEKLLVSMPKKEKKVRVKMQLQVINQPRNKKKESNYHKLCGKSHFAELLVDYLFPIITNDQFPIDANAPVYLLQKSYPNQYILSYHHLFAYNMFTDSYFEDVLAPLIKGKHSNAWITFFIDEFCTLLQVTTAKKEKQKVSWCGLRTLYRYEKRKLTCIGLRTLYFYDTLIHQLEVNHGKDERYKELFQKLQEIIYTYIQKLNGCKFEYVFTMVQRDGDSETEIYIASSNTAKTLITEGYHIKNANQKQLGFFATRYALQNPCCDCIKCVMIIILIYVFALLPVICIQITGK
jgi:hypothetical protein